MNQEIDRNISFQNRFGTLFSFAGFIANLAGKEGAETGIRCRAFIQPAHYNKGDLKDGKQRKND